MSALVIQGDTRSLPLPDESVDLVVTSPPYFALRSYTDDGQHYAGQIGSEDTPRGFIAALVACTREWVRVLKPEGSLFVNLGDKYSAHHGPKWGQGRNLDGRDRRRNQRGMPGAVPARAPEQWGIPAKSLMLLPERYRIACVDELGLIARAVICWSKPNGLPESVTDRVRRSHEDWVHLTRRPRYYSAVDEIRQPHAASSIDRIAAGFNRIARDAASAAHNGPSRARGEGDGTYTPNPLGALPGSVWTIPTEPLKLPDHLGVDHFAAFPSEWPRRLILGWSPPGICVECGAGRRPAASKEAHGEALKRNLRHIPGYDHPRGEGQRDVRYEITGYACDCATPDAPTRPSVVLDPFSGTGTTVAVADALGRTGIGVDLSHDYCRVARWRCTDEQLAGKVRGRMWAERQTAMDLGGVA